MEKHLKILHSGKAPKRIAPNFVPQIPCISVPIIFSISCQHGSPAPSFLLLILPHLISLSIVLFCCHLPRRSLPWNSGLFHPPPISPLPLRFWSTSPMPSLPSSSLSAVKCPPILLCTPANFIQRLVILKLCEFFQKFVVAWEKICRIF